MIHANSLLLLNKGDNGLGSFFIPTLQCTTLRHNWLTTRSKARGRKAQTPLPVLLAADSLSKRQEVANVKRCPAAADLHQRETLNMECDKTPQKYWFEERRALSKHLVLMMEVWNNSNRFAQHYMQQARHSVGCWLQVAAAETVWPRKEKNNNTDILSYEVSGTQELVSLHWTGVIWLSWRPLSPLPLNSTHLWISSFCQSNRRD